MARLWEFAQVHLKNAPLLGPCDGPNRGCPDRRHGTVPWIPACAGMTMARLWEFAWVYLKKAPLNVIPAKAGIHRTKPGDVRFSNKG